MGGFKVTKDMSTQLFKYVRRVDIKFNPFDNRTRSARELMRQVQATRIQKANPKIKINTQILGTVDPPSVEFEFVDGNKKIFDSQDMHVNEMLNEVFLAANTLDIEYELEGKSVDDK
mmetsp:Transcript_21261/g.24165  ORF Transcript_21261/g.24165 Transcript_21261/m.24165 type:complete len:117 (+) Transcript_21261:67-417(+)